MTALHYSRSEWREGDDPYGDIEESEIDCEHDRKKLGYERWIQIGDYPSSPIVLEVFIRKADPRFLVSVEGSALGQSEHVYATDLADVMGLLREWAPIAESASIVDLIRRVDECDEPHTRGELDGVLELAKRIKNA